MESLKMRNRVGIVLSAALLLGMAWARQQPSHPNNAAQGSAQQMPGMDMPAQDKPAAPAHDMSNMKDMPMDADSGASAMHSMEGHMNMGPHMKMTALRTVKPGDAAKAQQVV